MMSDLRIMKRFTATLSVVFLGAMQSWGAYGFFNDGGSFAIINSGSGDTYYDISEDTGNPDFHGNDFGDFDAQTDSLVLTGFENQTFENGGDGVMDGFLFYRVYGQGDSAPAWQTIAHDTYTDLGSGNERHENTGANIDLLAGLVDGDYYLELVPAAQVDWNGTDGAFPDDTIYTQQDGSTILNGGVASIPPAINPSPAFIFQAQFSVSNAVPEPSVVGLLGVALVLIRVMRTRTVAK